jgi:hypothetical protein
MSMRNCNFRRTADVAAARGLGWASIGIGLMEILAPKQIEKWMGISNGQNTGILRALAVREISHGVDILSHDDPAPGVRARVAGDMLDSVLLGLAAKRTKNIKGLMCVAAAVLPIVALDMIFAKRLSRD